MVDRARGDGAEGGLRWPWRSRRWQQPCEGVAAGSELGAGKVEMVAGLRRLRGVDLEAGQRRDPGEARGRRRSGFRPW